MTCKYCTAMCSFFAGTRHSYASDQGPLPGAGQNRWDRGISRHSVSKYFQPMISENVNFIYLLACQYYDMFVLGPKHSVKISALCFTFLNFFLHCPVKTWKWNFASLRFRLNCISFFFWPLMPLFPQCHQRIWQSSLQWRWKCIRLFDDPIYYKINLFVINFRGFLPYGAVTFWKCRQQQSRLPWSCPTPAPPPRSSCRRSPLLWWKARLRRNFASPTSCR